MNKVYSVSGSTCKKPSYELFLEKQNQDIMKKVEISCNFLVMPNGLCFSRTTEPLHIHAILLGLVVMWIKFWQSGKIHEPFIRRPDAYSVFHILPQLFSVSFRPTVSYFSVLSPRSDAYFHCIPMAFFRNQKDPYALHFSHSLSLFSSFFSSCARKRQTITNPQRFWSVVNSMLQPVILLSTVP